jgi:hypothetical protein
VNDAFEISLRVKEATLAAANPRPNKEFGSEAFEYGICQYGMPVAKKATTNAAMT